jgi:hypothetical protein
LALELEYWNIGKMGLAKAKRSIDLYHLDRAIFQHSMSKLASKYDRLSAEID